ncbi:MAG: class I SAM-dependent methyltransferase, partial [Bacteroidota bacterium]
MKKAIEKIKNGEALLPTEWQQLLLGYHKLNPGTTPKIFEDFKNSEGLNSYELLAKQIKKERSSSLEVLEIGCGNGTLSKYFTASVDEFDKYIGIDISSDQIDMAKKHYTKSNIFFRVADSGNLPYENEQFDFVISHLNFMLLNPVEESLLQIDRVLKNNGYFLAVVNSKKIKDNFFRNVLIAIGKYISRKYPNFRIKNGGNPNTMNREGLEILLKDFPRMSTNLEVMEHEFKRKMTAESFWSFIESMYNIFCLPTDYKN